MKKEEAFSVAQNLVNKTYHFVVSTIDKEGYPTSSVLIKLKNIELQEFYFSTNEESEKVENIKRNNQACIYCFDPFEYTGVTLLGTIQIIKQKNSHIEFTEDLFVEGLKSRNYVLLKFIPDKIKVYHLLNKIWIEDIQ